MAVPKANDESFEEFFRGKPSLVGQGSLDVEDVDLDAIHMESTQKYVAKNRSSKVRQLYDLKLVKICIYCK